MALRQLTIPAPLPLSTSLCGQSFSFQWLVRCPANPSAGTNFGITNCLTATVSGS